MKISEYNINYGNLDLDQIEVLKKQILEGNDIPIRYYKIDKEEYIIDGGHTFTAYQELNMQLPYLIEVKFTTPEDMIALSRRCNVNRIQQSPVSYAESIVKEVKLRLNIKDEEVKSVFYKYENIKTRGDKDDADICVILDNIFDKEKGEKAIHTFRSDYLPLLNLPEEIKQDVNKGKITKSAACEVAKVKNVDNQKKIVNIVKEDNLTTKETKEVIERVEKKNQSPEYAAYHIQEEKATKHYLNSPEHKQRKLEVDIPKLSTENYDIIYADPPWKYDFSVSDSRAIESHYPTMELEEICEYLNNIKISVSDNAVLFLWATQPKLREALKVIEAWNFEYKTGMVWIKDRIGMGYYVRGKHELLLIATKGDSNIPLPENRPESVLEFPRTEHSKKPVVFYEVIEKMYPKTKWIELFARNKRDNWKSLGNEIK